MTSISACSVFGVRNGTEQRDYVVLEVLSDTVEVRRYPEAVYIEARIADGESTARNAAFRSLFRYIRGANQMDRTIAMTAPVALDEPRRDGSQNFAFEQRAEQTTPNETAVQTTMRFYLPTGFSKTSAPIPSNTNLTLGVEAQRTVAVLRYTGSTSQPAFLKRSAELEKFLKKEERGWSPVSASYALYYDPPWTLPFLRRNEAVMVVEKSN